MDSLVSRHITIKSPAEQEKMRVAGRLAAEVLDMIGEHVKAGVSTEELDRLCFEHITEVQKSIPANVNYRGFPKTICSSVNHVVCHGIPNDKVLKSGDILNIDVTVIRDGFHGDTVGQGHGFADGGINHVVRRMERHFRRPALEDGVRPHIAEQGDHIVHRLAHPVFLDHPQHGGQAHGRHEADDGHDNHDFNQRKGPPTKRLRVESGLS